MCRSAGGRMNHITFSKKTKIVATIGPVTESERMMTALAKAGMDVVRLNFSHGDHAEHGRRIERARAVSEKLRKPIAVLQDLAGPKIRIGDFKEGKVCLKRGGTLKLTTRKVPGTSELVSVNYPHLPREVKKGNIILLDDGKKKLKVEGVSGDTIVCKVLVGGETKGRRGVNVPGVSLKVNAITPKDKRDLAFGVAHGVDFVALSFVRSAKDVAALRRLLHKERSDAAVIAKIETQEAVKNIDNIIEASDGIMIARGDLAIEAPPQDVPILQKMIVEKCNTAGKPVIVATQMLESMITSSVPTRAEVSDVANSILDGTDAVMLSEETTLGAYPVEAVTMMADVARRVEAIRRKKKIESRRGTRGVVDTLTDSVVFIADKIDAKAIVALTETGSTARMVSRSKPSQPIIVMSPNERALMKLTLSFGCHPVKIRGFKHVTEVTNEVSKFVMTHKLARKGDKALIAAGVPFGKIGGTNMLLVHVV